MIKQTTWKLAFFTKIDALIKAERIENEEKIKYQSGRSVSPANRLRGMSSSSSSTAISSAYWVASSSVAIGSALSSYD